MAQYGEYLDVYDSRKEEVYTLVDDYFDHPVMTKAGDSADLSIYMVKIHSLLALENRFLVATTGRDRYPMGFKIPLKEVPWVSFHTTRRENPERGYIPHKYVPKRQPMFQRRIALFKRDASASAYDADDLPVVVTIQHGKKSPYAYNQEGTITLALETFSTIITFKY